MGRRGPKPTPTKILQLRGSRRANLNPAEPEPPKDAPDRPDWLDGSASAMWDALAPQLGAMGVLTSVDGNVLARYCHLWSRWRDAEDFIKKYGLTYPLKAEDGSIRYFAQFPQVSIAHQLATQLGKLEAEMGLTPASRSRIHATPKEEHKEDDHARFFG